MPATKLGVDSEPFGAFCGVCVSHFGRRIMIMDKVVRLIEPLLNSLSK